MNPTNLVRSRARVAAMAVLLLLAAACSSSSPTKSSTATDSRDTATASDTDAGSVTTDDLEKVLPSASEVGDSYSEKDTSDSDSSTSSDSSDDKSVEAELSEQCPDLLKVFKNKKDHDTAKRTYESSAGGTIEVSLSTEEEPVSASLWDAQIKAINDCGKFQTTIGGRETALVVSAEKDDSLGEQGYILRFNLTVTIPEANKDFSLDLVAHGYRVDDVGVVVTATGDLDDETLSSIPPDEATAQKVATDLEPKVKELTGG